MLIQWQELRLKFKESIMQTLSFSFQISDSVYQNFTDKIGKENVARYFFNFINDYGKDTEKLPPAYQKIGGAKPFYIPDDFDDEMDFNDWLDDNSQDANARLTVTESKGAFDDFFGILQSEKSVSIEDMDKAIKMHGGQL